MKNRIEIAQEFANNINNKYIKRIVLFGSVARGEDNIDSDIDILIICNNREMIENKISDEKYDIITKYRELISAHIITEKHYEDTKDYSFLTNVRKEGIILAWRWNNDFRIKAQRKFDSGKLLYENGYYRSQSLISFMLCF